MTTAIRQPLFGRVSWGAIFAGFFFGSGIFLLLLSLGAGIGFTAFDPQDARSWQGLGIGFGIWGVICGIVSMFLAGWLAARLAASESKLAGTLHGAALWGFTLVAGLWIATMAVTRTAAAAAQAAGEAAQAAGEASADPQAREELRQRADEARGRAEGLAGEARANAGEAADTAKKAGAASAWAFFLYGVLTLAAAMLGGRAGGPRTRAVVTEAEPLPHGSPSPHRA